ncbi:MAG: hypothetical protein M1818_008071 [Claussenomyces sp. TS43310]|nr:MAG: hypothetical protein M1818_008071 [Claussenomyces sp. TS43310]
MAFFGRFQFEPSTIYLCTPAFLFLVYLIHLFFFNALSHLPGPAISKISNFWKLNAAWHEDVPKRLIALHRRYGPIVRIGPNSISVNDPAAYPVIYGSKRVFKKTQYLAAAEPWYNGKPVPTIITTRDEQYHSQLVRVAKNGYLAAAAPEVEARLQPLVDLALAKIEELGMGGQRSIDTSTIIAHYALDAMGLIFISEAFGFLKTGVDLGGTIGAVNILNKYFSFVTQTSWMHRYLLGNRFAQSFLEDANPIMRFVIPIVEKRIDGGQMEQRLDFLDCLLDSNAAVKDPATKLRYDQIVSLPVASIQAGYATVAIALRSIIYQLARNREAYQKLQREVDDGLASGVLSWPPGVAHAAKLPYLNAVIVEALRTNPVPGLILEREVPAEGVVLGGRHIPASTSVGFNPWVILSNTQVYGSDAHLFRPERWLEADENKMRDMKRYNISFGAGIRACQGKNVAMMVILKLIPALMYRFDFSLANPAQEWQVKGHFFTFQHKMDMVFMPREH